MILKETPLHSWHKDQKAHFGAFANYDMPMHYGSALQEHYAVRKNAGMFDISHMRFVSISGNDALSQLELLLANDVFKLQVSGKACYGCMLTENGGVIDDLITYFENTNQYYLVLNAGCAEKDLQWIKNHTNQLHIQDFPERAMIAVQGPNAITIFVTLFPEYKMVQALNSFSGKMFSDCFIARTGYTGEDGIELVCEPKNAQRIWQKLFTAGVVPCGLVARDSLRLEAGLNLYGADMDETVLPIECGLRWTVDMKRDRNFIGKKAILAANPDTLRKQVGLRLSKQNIARHGAKILEGGVVTSGGYAPSLDCAVAFALVPQALTDSETLKVEVRGVSYPASVCSTRFYKRIQ